MQLCILCFCFALAKLILKANYPYRQIIHQMTNNGHHLSRYKFVVYLPVSPSQTESSFLSRYKFRDGLTVSDQCAKKVLSDSPGLVDFAVGLENSVLNLPDGQVKFFEEFKLPKNCEINLLIKRFWG